MAAVKVDRQRRRFTTTTCLHGAYVVYQGEQKSERDESASRQDGQHNAVRVDVFDGDVAPDSERPGPDNLAYGGDQREREREANARAKSVGERVYHAVLAGERLGAAEDDAVNYDQRDKDA
jgi:hypothetical protein